MKKNRRPIQTKDHHIWHNYLQLHNVQLSPGAARRMVNSLTTMNGKREVVKGPLVVSRLRKKGQMK
uniref:Uncharacterized protein n=1 Tax=Rhodnius prolixus TaxID=13249 RepID=T1HS46_RHOPR